MISLVEILALVTLSGFAVIVARKRFRRGSALALVLTGFCAAMVSGPPAAATEFKSGPSIQISKDETVKGDVYATGQEISVDGTIDGDLYVWAQEATVRGHVTGDVFLFVQTGRIEGQVDGNVRGACNNVTISGTVGRNLMTWAQVINIDSRGSVGRSVTSFSQTLGIDGKVGGDLLIRNQSARIAGRIGGNIDEKGETLTIEDNADVSGSIQFEGSREPIVSKKAKLASQVQFTQHVQHRNEFGKSSAFWAVVLVVAFSLYGMMLFLVVPAFAQEAANAAENVGASLGLGLLVFFGVLIGAAIAVVTLVGMFVGFSTVFVWVIAVFAAQPVVGALVGQWIFGRTTHTWPLIGRMLVGVFLIRVCTLAPYGWILKVAVTLWGLGAISLALYRRFQPAAPAQAPYVPPAPLTPLTPVGGAPAV
jgi:cytoskeletal protein CcmA (bactofilin family)